MSYYHQDLVPYLWKYPTSDIWQEILQQGKLINGDWFIKRLKGLKIIFDEEKEHIRNPLPRNFDEICPIADQVQSLLWTKYKDEIKDIFSEFYYRSDKSNPGTNNGYLSSLTVPKTSMLPDQKEHFLNLTPEWIRHSLDLWYDKDKFPNAGPESYYPFKYKDHIAHPIMVWLLGHLLLDNYQFDTDALAAICNVTKSSEEYNVTRDEIFSTDSIADVVYVLWNNHNPSFTNESSGTFNLSLSDISYKEKVMFAWQDISLWHDAGYDTMYWFYLNAFESSHLSQYKPEYFTEAFKNILTNLTNLISNAGVRAFAPLKEDLNKISSSLKSKANPLEIIYAIDDSTQSDANKRKWGRTHAIISAHEYYYHHQYIRNHLFDLTLPVLAIAEHHEPILSEKENSDDLNNATEFVRNPFASILRWADELAHFPRLKIKWPKKMGPNIIPFKCNWGDHKPINLEMVQKRNKKRLRSVSGKPNSQNKTKKRYLWGDTIINF